jgi:hypothetical protein
MSLRLVQYNEKSLAVYGDITNPKHVAFLESLKGLHNAKLKEGPGYIFPLKHKEALEAYVGTGAVKGVPVQPPQPFQPESQPIKLLKLKPPPAPQVGTSAQAPPPNQPSQLDRIERMLEELLNTVKNSKK